MLEHLLNNRHGQIKGRVKEGGPASGVCGILEAMRVQVAKPILLQGARGGGAPIPWQPHPVFTPPPTNTQFAMHSTKRCWLSEKQTNTHIHT